MPITQGSTEAIRAFLAVGLRSPRSPHETKPDNNRFSFLEHPSAPRDLSRLRGSRSAPGSTQGTSSHECSSDSSLLETSYSAPTPIGSDNEEPLRRKSRRGWDRIISSLSPKKKGKGKAMIDDGPLDGEEGELVDDEGFFDSAQARARIDLITLLPVELSLYIFSLLDLSSVLSCIIVNQYWKALATDDAVWRALFHAQPGWRVDVEAAHRRLATNVQRHQEAVLEERGIPIPSSSTRNPRVSISSILSPSILLPTIFSSSPTPSSKSYRTSMQASRITSRTSSADHGDMEDAAPSPLDWKDLFKSRFILDRRWRLGFPRVRQLMGHQSLVYCVKFDRDRIISGSRDRTIRVWNTHTGQLISTLRGHDGSVLCLKFDGKSSFLVSGSSDGSILIWDLEKGIILHRIMKAHEGGVLTLDFDDQRIVSGGRDNTVRVWDRQSYDLKRIMTGHEGPVNCIILQGSTIVSASGDGKLMMWNIETAEILRRFEGHSRGIACVALTDHLVISGSKDPFMKLYDASTGTCLETVKGHHDLVRSLAVNRTMNRVISASYDKSVKVWDVDAEGKELKLVRDFPDVHDSQIFDVACDVSRIATASYSHVVTVLDFGYDLDTSLFA
ncbi:WD40 repeat-like protein [Dacryopinax primogenitus]|uniref:WD40 repeat-like protein n=1 Tax=Dacryopinax primogenitus (strain DJM 731) TaxID=1858805 RepID=M5GBG8_DACPD|nr:WD40 repeat-like protein [Dacryopinax primogenitus]EJU01348.1 WD40 repeat-like protein [Dacryopinax primogenitus]